MSHEEPQVDLVAPRTAIVIMDLQGGVSTLEAMPHSFDSVVAGARQLVDAGREAGAKIIFVRAGGEPDGLDWPLPVRPRGDVPAEAMEVDPGLGMRPDDLLITKRQWGAFYGTDLDLQLRRRGIDTLVLSGISTNHCVETTGRDAWERDYRVIFASDAMSGIGPGQHEFAVSTIFPQLGHVLDVAETVRILAASKDD